MAQKRKQLRPNSELNLDKDLQLRILTELHVSNELLCELVSHSIPASDDSKYAAELKNTKDTYKQIRDDTYAKLQKELG